MTITYQIYLISDSTGETIDRIANIMVSNEELILRLGGRWICRGCQQPYHEINSPPKVEGKCDSCQGDLYQREDDNPEAVAQRIKVFGDQTNPLICYYTEKGTLVNIDGEGSIEQVKSSLIGAVS